jgi:hypothetical protein
MHRKLAATFRAARRRNQYKGENMHRIRLMGLALIAVLALGALVATAAMAEKPEFSPAEKNVFTTSGGAAKFEQKEGIAAVSATKSKGSGEITNAKEGTFSETFEGATAPLSGKCTGLSDLTAGNITTKGTFKIGYLDTAKTKVGVGFTIGATHFECEKTITLVTVEGSAVGLITPINTKTKTFKVELKQSKGVNEFVELLNKTNSAFEKLHLTSEINGGTVKQSGQETTVTITTTKEASIVA